MPWLEPVTLVGPHARLEPLSHAPSRGLTEAVKDGELWKLWYTAIPKPEDMAKEIDRRLGLQAKGLDAAVHGGRCQRQDRGNVDLHECRCRQPPRRDRLDLVCQARAAHRAQHPVQTAAADACVRKARLHRGRIPHAFLQPSEPARHRAAGRQAGRHSAQPSDRAERHAARHRGVQHHRLGMADGEGASHLSTQRQSRGGTVT